MGKAVLIGLFFLCAVAKSQLPQYHARIFDARHGLNATLMVDIFKDKQDFLWITYSNLLEKFDGRVSQRYHFQEDLLNTINDRENNTWAISRATVYRLDNQQNKFERIPFDTTGGVQLSWIFQLQGQPVFIQANNGFYAWDETLKRFQKTGKFFRPASRRNGPTFNDTCQNSFFFTGNGQLYAYDLLQQKVDSVPVSGLFSVYALTSTLAIYGDFRGYAHWCDFKTGKVTLIDAEKYFPGQKIDHFRVNGVQEISKGKYLMLTKAGLMEYDLAKDAFTYLGIYEEGKPFELENTMTGLMIDKNGTAWAHSVTMVAAFSPINSVLGLMRNNESDPDKKWNNTVAAFAEGKDDDLWMATGRGFARLNRRNGKVEAFQPVEDATDRLSHESIRGILFDGQYVILAPTDKGVWLFDPVTKKYRRPVYANEDVQRYAEHDFYDMIYTVRNGDHLFPGRDALYKMDGKTLRLEFLPLTDTKVNYNVAYQDSRGRIWIGTSTNIFCLSEDYRLLFKIDPAPSVVASFFETADNELFIGTSKGIFRITYNSQDTGAMIQAVNTPFNSIPVGAIFRDKLNRYWFSTVNGLFLGDRDLRAFRIFDYADNIQSPHFSGNSYIRCKDGMVFLGGRHGLNYFIPEKIPIQDYPLNVFVRSVIVNNMDTLTAGNFQQREFDHNQNRMTLELTTPYFNNAGKIQYRYQLKGLSEEWTHNGNNNVISFTSLPPGDYELRVAASTTGKYWYETKEPLSFSIAPPVWKRPWFIAMGILLIIGSLLWLQRKREVLILKKEEEKLVQEQLKAENLQYKLEANQAQLAMLENERKAATAKLQSMRLQMNPHFLFNALNSIQQMIMTGNEKNATLYLSKFSKLLRMVLTHSDREVVSLREESEMLKLYIELEALRFEDTFQYKVEIEEGIDADDNKVPTLLIQPFVENAIWHGLLHKEGIRKLDVVFRTNENEDLVCIVEDNGIGRAAARVYSEKSAAHQNHTGKGVSVADERLKIFNQHNGDSSKLDITDKMDSSGQNAGTRVTITLPNLA